MAVSFRECNYYLDSKKCMFQRHQLHSGKLTWGKLHLIHIGYVCSLSGIPWLDSFSAIPRIVTLDELVKGVARLKGQADGGLVGWVLVFCGGWKMGGATPWKSCKKERLELYRENQQF